ncbi:hypothetical protein G6F22_003195 [Rhizopus arrhizus]|nr:hypothetical protein G6F22_003195 [Rhizopus arrhizus]
MAIVKVSPTQNESYLSNFFTIQEPTKRRPILDCSQLNRFLQYQHFKMEGVPALRQIIEKDDLMCKVDLKDAYVVVPIHPAPQQYLTFKHQGVVYQYKSMAFGRSVALRVFTKIMRYALEPLRRKGIRFVSSHQLGEKCSHPQPCPRIPWLCFQHQEDVNFGSCSEITEIDDETEANIESSSSTTIMQMDSESSGEDGGDDPSNRGSITTPVIHAERSSKIITPTSSKLNGLDIQNPAERNPDLTIHCDASDLGWGVSSHEMEISGRWTNEEKTTSINVRELKTILFALKLHAEKFREKNIQIFTDNITALKYSTKAGGTASPLLQELAIEIQDVINSYNLTVTYSHIPEILNVKADTLSRIKASNPLYEATMPKKWFQVINQKMGPLKIDGFAARHNTKLKTFWSYRADPEARAVDAFRQVWPKKVEGSGIGHPMVADPILVSDTITNETSIATVDIQDKKELDSSHLALISNKWTSDGISKRTQEFFLKANRYNTHRAYNGIWKKFSHWCQKQMPVQNPEEYNVSNVLGFLMEHNRLSIQTLNDYRSAIASVYSQLHPNQPPLASQHEITMFFKAKKDTEVRIPTVDKLETWDINILILYIRKELSPSTVLTLGQLQLKVILLMCINTMWRPRSDMGRIQWRDVQFTHIDGVPGSVCLHIRRPKEINTKSIQLGVIQQEDLSVDHTLFLGVFRAETVKRTVWFLTEHQTQIRNLKKQGFNIIGYARKSEGAEDNETRIKLLKLMCRRLKERSLVNHIFISYNSQANGPLAQRDMK